ncbi:MAG: methyl-accepting chemotaxis protein [Cyanophyceae cyanobacterium]
MAIYSSEDVRQEHLSPEPTQVANGNTPGNDTPDNGKATVLAAPKKRRQGRRRFGLRQKATLLAIAVGTIPVAVVGAVAYRLASQSLTEEIVRAQESITRELAREVEQFTEEIVKDVQLLTQSPLLVNPDLNQVATRQQQVALLNNLVEVSAGIEESIAVYDLQGNFLFGSEGIQTSAEENESEEEYFQRAVASRALTISDPQVTSDGEISVHIVAPLEEMTTGSLIGLLELQVAADRYADVFVLARAQNLEYKLVDANGAIFVADETEWMGQALSAEFGEFPQLEEEVLAAQNRFPDTDEPPLEAVATGVLYDEAEQEDALVTYIRLEDPTGMGEPSWSLAIAQDTGDAFAPINQLRLTFLLGTGVAALLVGAIAAIIARQAVRPLVASASAVEQIGRGDLETRLPVRGSDELAVLGDNINLMAEQIQTLVASQTAETERQKQQNQALQQELLGLIEQVDQASKGDLTVRAEITSGEIGVIADVFNVIVESLRELVGRVKQTAIQVSSSVGTNEESMRQLAEQAAMQASQVEQIRQSVEEMSGSIQSVAQNTRQAATVARSASTTAETGGVAMERTVRSIVQLRETISETGKKVKRLGEASQQISRVVALINQIALKTNLLAVNASIEAARAGEEGLGFAVVAEEVGELAAQSATATTEIEQIVENIQRETEEVVKAMNLGTTQVAQGTRQVAETRQSLTQIVEVSRQIDELLQSIVQTTISQAQTSRSINDLMENIAHNSTQTSNASSQVSRSLQETVQMAQELENSVATFTVEERA